MFCAPKRAEIIAMAAAASQTDAAFGSLGAPLRLTSSFIFGASLTLFKERGEEKTGGLRRRNLPKFPSEDAAGLLAAG